MSNELKDKKFFIISKEKYIGYRIYDSKSYDLTTAVRKLLALDELKDNKDTSYHLQEVNFSMVDKPLRLTDEVENSDQEELPFWSDLLGLWGEANPITHNIL